MVLLYMHFSQEKQKSHGRPESIRRKQSLFRSSLYFVWCNLCWFFLPSPSPAHWRQWRAQTFCHRSVNISKRGPQIAKCFCTVPPGFVERYLDQRYSRHATLFALKEPSEGDLCLMTWIFLIECKSPKLLGNTSFLVPWIKQFRIDILKNIVKRKIYSAVFFFA